MVANTDKESISDPFLDRRVKLLPCQKEMVTWWYNQGMAIKAIARIFKVNKRTVQFIIFPERQTKNSNQRGARGGWEQYYDKGDHSIAVKDHRAYKKQVLNNNYFNN
jgi:transposase